MYLLTMYILFLEKDNTGFYTTRFGKRAHENDSDLYSTPFGKRVPNLHRFGKRDPDFSQFAQNDSEFTLLGDGLRER